ATRGPAVQERGRPYHGSQWAPARSTDSSVADVDAADRFAALVQGPPDHLRARLDEAALLIAAQARPDLDIGAYLRRLDRLAATCPEPTVDGLRRHLFTVHGFAGNTADYYDPANSYLDQVLDRGLGLPITLAIMMMEVARRLGVTLYGLNNPGHFLVRHGLAQPPELYDPFDGGRGVDPAGIDPAILEPAGAPVILARTLANLDQIFRRRGDRRSREWATRLRASVPGVPLEARAEWADALAGVGRLGDAADVLDRLAELSGDEKGERFAGAASRLRARLN
ncbi:MAG: transglutaminase family protein, partial [Acidimicrobiales bacterium]